jgi:hypothetical protein
LIHATIQLDPLIYQALAEIASMRTGGNRAQLIRDALYTLVWNERRGGPRTRRALDCPQSMHGQDYRLRSGKVVEIDLSGLEINDQLRRSVEACQEFDNFHRVPTLHR